MSGRETLLFAHIQYEFKFCGATAAAAEAAAALDTSKRAVRII